MFRLAGSLLLLEWIKTLEELRKFSSREIFLVTKEVKCRKVQKISRRKNFKLSLSVKYNFYWVAIDLVFKRRISLNGVGTAILKVDT